jgi:hypothetical protein
MLEPRCRVQFTNRVHCFHVVDGYATQNLILRGLSHYAHLSTHIFYPCRACVSFLLRPGDPKDFSQLSFIDGIPMPHCAAKMAPVFSDFKRGGEESVRIY